MDEPCELTHVRARGEGLAPSRQLQTSAVAPGWLGSVPQPHVRPGTQPILLVDSTRSLSKNASVDFERTEPELSYTTG